MTTADRLDPTPEQQAVVDAARSGKELVVQAGAGTGKTSTLRMVAQALEGKSVMYLAYNKAIASEAAASFPDWVNCRTAHSLAMGTVGQRFRHRINGPRQQARHIAEFFGVRWLDLSEIRVPPVQIARAAINTVLRYCHSADAQILPKHVPRQPRIERADHEAFALTVVPHAQRAWEDVCHPDGMVRFQHDHYLKMWALSEPVLKADVVLLDEAQDSNPVVAQVVKTQSRAQRIIVGDSNQSMYEWRGAVDALADWPADEHLYLSQSWRFGQAVADEANKWLSQLNTPLRLTGNPAVNSQVSPIQTPAAVLCRTNGEAMGEVLTMLAAGRPVALAGGGTAIRLLAEAAADLKAGRRTGHPELFVFPTWGDVQDYAHNDDAGADLKPFVKLIDDYGTDVVLSAVDALVDETRARTIVSTVHKAKGREWDSVKIGADFPEPIKDDDGKPGPIKKGQAMLGYVAVTRARNQLDRGGLAWIDHYLQAAAEQDNAPGDQLPTATPGPDGPALQP